MNNTLKTKILKSLENIYRNDTEIDKKTKLENMMDILNLTKIIEDYEELEPDIKNMLNKKAWKEKWER